MKDVIDKIAERIVNHAFEKEDKRTIKWSMVQKIIKDHEEEICDALSARLHLKGIKIVEE